MATITDQMLQRFFEILQSSKLPSELQELLAAPTSSHFCVIQQGENDAQKISISRLRGIMGGYNASTNTPSLSDGSGGEGDTYVVTHAGTRDFGSGIIELSVGDVLQYLSGAWRKTGYALKKQTILDLLGFTPENIAEKGVANGYAPLNDQVKIDAIYLPAYVEEIVEGTYVDSTTFNDETGTAVTPSKSKIYLDTTTSIAYRWSGSQYLDIKSSPGTSDDVAEGSVNLYFTDSRVLAAVLSGLSVTNSKVVDGDTVLTAFGKLQGQINDILNNLASRYDEVQAYDSQATGVEGVLYLDATNGAIYHWINSAYQRLTSSNDFSDAYKDKLDGIESGATADMTGAEIKALYEAEANTNAFTDAEKTKLAGLESSKFKGTYLSLSALETAIPTGSEGDYAHVDSGAGGKVELYVWDSSDSQWRLVKGEGTEETAASIKTKYESNADTNAYTDSEKTKLAGIEEGATADMTDAEIKTAYENNADTNAFTDAEKTKLAGIEDGATAGGGGGYFYEEINVDFDSGTMTQTFDVADSALVKNVYINGKRLVTGSQWVVATTTSITIQNYTLEDGQNVTIVSSEAIPTDVPDDVLVVAASRNFDANDSGKKLLITGTVTLTYPAGGLGNKFKVNFDIDATGQLTIADENAGADLDAADGTILAAGEMAHGYVRPDNSKFRLKGNWTA